MIGRPRIGTLERYFARQIYSAVGFVLLGFLALFAFFDLIKELGDLGNGSYGLRAVFTFVVLSIPAHAYEPLPRSPSSLMRSKKANRARNPSSTNPTAL